MSGGLGSVELGTLLLIVLCGGAGAAARFVVDGLIRSRWTTAFPVATFVVNVSGSLIIGLVTGALLLDGAGETWRLLAAVGFCGGYTTLSTAMVETVRLVQSDRTRLAVANAVGTMVVTVVAVAAGIGIMQLLS